MVEEGGEELRPSGQRTEAPRIEDQTTEEPKDAGPSGWTEEPVS